MAHLRDVERDWIAGHRTFRLLQQINEVCATQPHARLTEEQCLARRSACNCDSYHSCYAVHGSLDRLQPICEYFLSQTRVAIIEEQASSPSFTCFSDLPLEIRCKIWEAAFQPRIVSIDLDFIYHGADRGLRINRLRNSKFCIDVYNLTPNPITLFINQESRRETLRHYLQPFQQNPVFFHPELDSVARFFTSYNTTTAELEGRLMQHVIKWSEAICSELMQNVRSLILPRAHIDKRVPLKKKMEFFRNPTIFNIENLKELIIIEDKDSYAFGQPVVPSKESVKDFQTLLEEGFKLRKKRDDDEFFYPDHYNLSKNDSFAGFSRAASRARR